MKEDKKEKIIKTKEKRKHQHRKWETFGSRILFKKTKKKNAQNWSIECDAITMVATIPKLWQCSQFKYISYKFLSHASLDVFEVSYIQLF